MIHFKLTFKFPSCTTFIEKKSNMLNFHKNIEKTQNFWIIYQIVQQNKFK